MIILPTPSSSPLPWGWGLVAYSLGEISRGCEARGLTFLISWGYMLEAGGLTTSECCFPSLWGDSK